MENLLEYGIGLERCRCPSGSDEQWWGVADHRSPEPFSASTVERVCRALGEAVTGGQIQNLIAPLKVPEPTGEERNTKWKRLFNAVAAAQNRQHDGRPLVRLVSEVMRPVRFDSPAEFEAHRTAVNERLLLSGLQVRDDGKVAQEQVAQTLAEAQHRADELRAELSRRDVHLDVLHFCRAELMQRATTSTPCSRPARASRRNFVISADGMVMALSL